LRIRERLLLTIWKKQEVVWFVLKSAIECKVVESFQPSGFVTGGGLRGSSQLPSFYAKSHEIHMKSISRSLITRSLTRWNSSKDLF
jgi:hypothetical protein